MAAFFKLIYPPVKLMYYIFIIKYNTNKGTDMDLSKKYKQLFEGKTRSNDESLINEAYSE